MARKKTNFRPKQIDFHFNGEIMDNDSPVFSAVRVQSQEFDTKNPQADFAELKKRQQTGHISRRIRREMGLAFG